MERRVKRFLVIAMLLLLQGCSLDNLFVSSGVDKVYVVKYNTYVKHRRAYFSRDDLRRFPNGKRYLFLYNRKTHNLGVLLRTKHAYKLYSFSHSNRSPLTYRQHLHSYKKALRYFAKKGYYRTNIHALGYVVKTGLRRYKGVKTLMIDVKDYSALKKRYLQAIRSYDASRISSIKEKLPASFIKADLLSYYKKAQNQEQREQLLRIADKLGIHIPHTSSPSQEEGAPKRAPSGKSYYYYLYFAPTTELKAYITKGKADGTLTPKKQHELEARLWELRKNMLLENGSLDALIEAYKEHKDPAIKQRIMELLKVEQEKKRS
jgi:hypothetical protein